VSVVIKVRRLPHAEGLPLPRYETAEAAGLDLLAAVPDDAPVLIARLRRALVPTGLALQVPGGYEAQVRPRSGLASKHGVTLVNSPGTIDADYRGEVHVPLINHGAEPFVVERGMRVAQIVVLPVPPVQFVEVDELDETERGRGGFGHTGH